MSGKGWRTDILSKYRGYCDACGLHYLSDTLFNTSVLCRLPLQIASEAHIIIPTVPYAMASYVAG